MRASAVSMVCSSMGVRIVVYKLYMQCTEYQSPISSARRSITIGTHNTRINIMHNIPRIIAPYKCTWKESHHAVMRCSCASAGLSNAA